MKNGLIILVICCSYFFSCKKQEVSIVPEWDIFEGEIINTGQYDDPYSDVDLFVSYTRPDQTEFTTYGFYDGGVTWRFRCMPDMEGEWQFKVRFSDRAKPRTGTFICVKSDLPGIVGVSENNPVWLGFKRSKPIQIRSFHVGDRFFAANFDPEHRSEFLDWAQNQGYNMLSMASHLLNRKSQGRGMGWNTPELWPLNAFEYRKMENILYDLKDRKILVFPFAGFFGRSAMWPSGQEGQELFIKYTLARIAPLWNLLFNIAGPEPLHRPEDFQGGQMSEEDINRIAGLIKTYDPYNHVLSVHNRTINPDTRKLELDPFIFESWEDYAVLQGAKGDSLKMIYSFVQEARKIVKPVYAQEVLWHGNMYHDSLSEDQMRKKAIVLIMAGAFINFGDMNGNSSSGFSNTLDPDSASTQRHRILHQVWDFFDYIPFDELFPRPDLVNEGFCLAREGVYYLVYLDRGGEVHLALKGSVQKATWIDAGSFKELEIPIGDPEMDMFISPDEQDWFLWVEMKPEV